MTPLFGTLWLALAGAFVLVGGMVPIALAAWRSLGRRDQEVSLRKVHRGDIPRVGGLAVMLGFGVVVLAGLAGVTELSATHELLSVSPLTGALLGALVVGLTGIYDDLVGLRAGIKLAMQVAAAGIAVLYGVHWPALQVALGPEFQALAPWLTGLFLLAVVNAINFMDGLDGLAGGIVAIGLTVVFTALASQSQMLGAGQIANGWTAAAALGATCGFLVHNRWPARVFMGDAGAYFLGFLLAALLLTVEPVRMRVSLVRLSIPLLVLALPLFDIVTTVLRRKVRGQPLFAGDCDHVHHRLLAAGLTHPQAVLVLWGCSAMFAVLGLLNVVGVGGWWTLLGTVLATVAAAIALGYHRLLSRLPALCGEHMGWRDRRRAVIDLVESIDRLHREGPRDHGLARWKRLADDVARLLAEVAVPAFEIRTPGGTAIARGCGAEAWAWLDLPMPGEPNAEVRLALVVRLPDLQHEQLMLLERTVRLLAGDPSTSRQLAPLAPRLKIAS